MRKYYSNTEETRESEGITQGHGARKLESEYKPTDSVYNCAVNLGI